MMKAISAFLLCLMLPQFVFASNHDLKSLMDEYHYTMTVEWDQKDQSFAQSAKEHYFQRMHKMVQNGMTKEEVALATGVDIAQIENELKLLNISDAEAISNFVENHRSFKKGASWNEGVVGGIIIGTILVALITVLVVGAVRQNNRYDQCVEENGGDKAPCIDNPWVLGND